MHATIHPRRTRAALAAGAIATLGLMSGCFPSTASIPDYTLWWDTTATTTPELTAEQKDDLYRCIRQLVTTQGLGPRYAKRIDPNDPISSVHQLDPYSDIYSDSLSRIADIIDPEFFNDNPYGLTLEQTDEGARIVRIRHSRSCMLPLYCGETITMISGRAVADLSGDELAIALYRAAGRGAQIEVRFTGGRQRTKLPRVANFEPRFITSRMLDDTTGYVRFESFTDRIDEWVALVASHLRDIGMTNLVLDLRGNRGGAVNACLRTIKLFSLNTGKDTLRVGGSTDVRYYKENKLASPFFDLPLVILVDRYTASAAEVFAGTLQDRDRAIVVGEQTYGKAMTVREFDLPYHLLFWMTTGWIYLPSGRTYELPHAGSTMCYPRLTFDRNVDNFDHHYESNALQYPMDRFRSRNLHRALWSEAAIVPDYLVYAGAPNDRWEYYYLRRLPRVLAYDYASRVMNSNEKDSITYYYTPESFEAAYTTPPELMKEILRCKDLYRIPGDVSHLLASEPEIRCEFSRALTAELFGMRYYSDERLASDRVVQEALKHRAVAAKLAAN